MIGYLMIGVMFIVFIGWLIHLAGIKAVTFSVFVTVIIYLWVSAAVYFMGIG